MDNLHDKPEQEQLMSDQINYGMSVTQGGKRIDPMSIYKEPEQEPVAFASHGVVNWIADKQFQHEAHLYSVPQRTWVGLTDDDKVLIKHDANFNQFMTAGEYADRVQQLTEARLKDKNT